MRAERKLTSIACVGVGLIGLGGCSYAPQDQRAAYESGSDTTATERPLAQLPSQAGAVIAVLQSRASGVLTQRVVLAGDTGVEGENSIVVKVAEKPGPGNNTEISSWRPSESSVAHELDDAFPTIEMRVSTAWNRNEFGPFGYAIGDSQKGVACGYAWQFSPGTVAGPLDTRLSPAYTLAAAPTATSIRVRLCRMGLKEADFAAYVKSMRVMSGVGVDAAPNVIYSGLGASPEGDTLASAGAPSDPTQSAPPKKVHKKVVHRRQRPAPRPAVASRAKPEIEPVVPPVNAAVVPLPGGGSTRPGATASVTNVNPLLAPLQGGSAGRPDKVIADDMPLPGRLTPGAKATTEPKPVGIAPMPMPVPN